MIISSKDLEKVCNYVESTKPSLPQAVMTFMDWQEEPNEEYLRALKSKNRGLAIDAILDDKIEEFNNRENSPLDNEGFIFTISPKINSMNVQGKNYYELGEIFKDVMTTLDNITSKPMNIPQNLNITIQKDSNLSDYENEMSVSRKVISKIMMVSNLISSTGRTGPANTIITGYDAYKYLIMQNSIIMTNSEGIVSGLLNGINVIQAPYIKSNKIILMRNVNKTENGLNVINCPNDLRYYLKETPNFDKVINWFEIN
jgi:hypothetical protein